MIAALATSPARGQGPGEPYDAAEASGLYDGNPVATYGAYPFDFNEDGWRDVFIVPHNHAGRLYRNDGGFFTRIDHGTFLRRDRHGCAWGDANVDGLWDLYCALGGFKGMAPKKNELWIQDGDGIFSDEAASFGVTNPYGRGREVTFVHANRDRYPDLYVTNDYPRADGHPSPNKLFINRSGRRFRSAPRFGLNVNVGGVGGFGTCVQAVDYNRDGWEDLLVCGKKGPRLYRNRRGESFVNVRQQAGISGGVFLDAVLADMNGDRTWDFVGLTAGRLIVQLRLGGAFRAPVVSRPILGPSDVAVGDVNRDRLRDIYITTTADSGTNRPDLMLVNRGTGKAYASVDIPQTTEGAGHAVTSIDYDGNGASDFIVLNGRKLFVGGPIQLVAFP
jgi:hypothetical protein